jgi:hypothetical protein
MLERRHCCAMLLTMLLAVTTLAAGAEPQGAVAASKREVRLSPSSGKVGSSVTVDFSGFSRNRTITIAWDGKTVATARTSIAGDGSATFTAPIARRGNHKVSATIGATSASATFRIVPSLSVSRVTNTVGNTITATLRGYAKGESIAIDWDTTTRTLLTVIASTTGSASAQVAVPPTTGGKHKLVGLGDDGSRSQVTMIVKPSIALSPRSGTAGTNVRVVLRGYGKSERIEMQWRVDGGTLSLEFATASLTGSVNVTVTVPDDAEPGTYAIIARGYDVTVTEAPFRVT